MNKIIASRDKSHEGNSKKKMTFSGRVGSLDRVLQEGYSEPRTEWEEEAKQRRVWRKGIQGEGAACPRGMHLACLRRTGTWLKDDDLRVKFLQQHPDL